MICNPPSKKVRPPLEGFAIPSQYNESLVKKYIELCCFSHFFRIFATLLCFITNNLIYSIIP